MPPKLFQNLHPPIIITRLHTNICFNLAVPVGAIVGGVLGGSFLLCCVWTSLLCVVLVTRKRRNSSRAANISDSASAPYHAARFEETKVTNYQLELKDSK